MCSFFSNMEMQLQWLNSMNLQSKREHFNGIGGLPRSFRSDFIQKLGFYSAYGFPIETS